MYSAPDYQEFAHYVTTMGLKTYEARHLPTAADLEESVFEDSIFKDNMKHLMKDFLETETGHERTLPTLEGETKSDCLTYHLEPLKTWQGTRSLTQH